MEVEELTVAYSDEDTGEEVIKEIGKEILSKGAWPTVMFFYQERDPKSGEFTEPKVSLRRNAAPLIDTITGAPGRLFPTVGSEVVSCSAVLQMPCTKVAPSLGILLKMRVFVTAFNK